MPNPAQTTVNAPNQGPAFSAVGDIYRVLASGDQTGGAYALSEARVFPNGGPPPHIHRREDEAFYVLEGTITFTVNGQRVVAGPGTFLQAPRNIPHTFKNETTSPARMLIFVTPSGFEKFIAQFAQPVPSFDSPPLPVSPEDLARLMTLAPQFGIEILPPH
jgi:quercetin dioxygenase-like cupin family protein